MSRPALACIWMASGQGKRFGSNKLLAQLPAGTLLDYTLSAVPAHCFAQRLVVTRWPQVAALCRSRLQPVLLHNLVDRNDVVRLAVQAIDGADGCMFLPVDQPLVQPQSLERLAAAFAAQPLCIHRLSWQGQGQSPVIFPAHLFCELVRLPSKKGGGAVIAAHPELVRLTAANQAWELWDVDTPEDLERISLLPAAARLPGALPQI